MADITVKLPNLANQTAIVNALNKISQQTLDVRSLVANSIKENWKTIYPVGSIYISVSSASPASLFGGSWEQIKDRFLLAAGSSYSAGTTGGEATHTLTVSEMPSHSHKFILDTRKNSGNGTKWDVDAGTVGEKVDKGRYTENSGGNQPHNNMPPYITVYMWKRVS